ncbi:HD domain-containing protein 2 [Tanacetum coccineum]
MAATTTNPSSSTSPHTLHFTNPHRIIHPSSLKLPFNSHKLKLTSIQCQAPKRSLISSDVTEPTSSSCSSSIDFLTLCHSLKVDCLYANKLEVKIEALVVYYVDNQYNEFLEFSCDLDLNEGRMGIMSIKGCIKIAIVHDIAEAIVGDITPSDGVPKAEKSRLEQAALKEMCNVLGGGMRAQEIQELWREYEDNASLEANLVKDFDKVEMILQALEYETEHNKVLDEFFLSTAAAVYLFNLCIARCTTGKFQTEIGKSWAAEIIARRNTRLAKKLN